VLPGEFKGSGATDLKSTSCHGCNYWPTDDRYDNDRDRPRHLRNEFQTVHRRNRSPASGRNRNRASTESRDDRHSS